jgi:hypothetical protein
LWFLKLYFFNNIFIDAIFFKATIFIFNFALLPGFFRVGVISAVALTINMVALEQAVSLIISFRAFMRK